jgi:serine/threonine-protein kinase
MTSSSWGFAEGDAITDRLVAVHLLGGGAAYEAYLAFDRHLYAPVVVKVVRPDQVSSASTLRGLERETDLVGSLNHPSLVRGFHAVLGGERPHLVLENLDGPRLSSLIRRHGPLPMQQLLPLGLELASVLHYLGEQQIVHLDIKPANIIMGAPARVIDLSVARTLDEAERLTYSVGTDAYMAPEQCDPPSSGRPGPASDIWAVGATLFHAVAGYKPFARGERDEEAPAERRFPQLMDRPMLLPSTVPVAVAELIEDCLAFEPAHRPSPQRVAERLEPLLGALPRPRLAGFKVSIN